MLWESLLRRVPEVLSNFMLDKFGAGMAIVKADIGGNISVSFSSSSLVMIILFVVE